MNDAYQRLDLVKSILETNCMHDKQFILNLLKNNLQQAKKACEASNLSRDYLNHQYLKYNHFIKEISIKIDVEMKDKLAQLIEQLFESTQLDIEKSNNVIQSIHRANAFYKKYSHEDYHDHTDIITALAYKLKNMMTQNQKLLPMHCQRIIQLLMQFYPEIQKEQIEKMHELLIKLPEEINSSNQMQEAQTLHFLINYLETPFLSEETLAIALQRHKTIAKMYHEKWIDDILFYETPNIENAHTKILVLYIKNVLLNLTPTSASLTLDNFDNNKLCLSFSQISKSFPFIKDDLEKNIFNKINNHFLIKENLTQTSYQMNLGKLRMLINKIDAFFSNKELAANLKKSVQAVCVDMTKAYCIDCLRNNSPLDEDYLNNLNTLLNETLYSDLRNDSDVLSYIKHYVGQYNGAHNHFALLLTQLLPPNDISLQRYAEKRSNYIESQRSATKNDYVLYAYLDDGMNMATRLETFKNAMLPYCKSALENDTWNEDKACLIELICDKDAIIHYRKKFLNITLKKIINKTDTDASLNQAIESFLKAINPGKSINEYADNDLQSYLVKCINECDWSLPLETLITHFGQDDILKQLHVNLLIHYLDQKNHFIDDWLGLTIKNHTARLSNEACATFFIHFFGQKNIQTICHSLEKLAAPLTTVLDETSMQSLAESDYAQLKNSLLTLKPLITFYLCFGKNLSVKNTLAHLDAIHKKLSYATNYLPSSMV